MILINRGQANIVVLTLKEKQTLSSPVFLFVFQNELTRQFKRFIAADVSGYTDRYNRFTITESDSESVLTGTVQLKPTGFWRYWVYEQTSTTNLEASQATSELERGKVNVRGTVQAYSEYDNQQKTYTVYGSGA